MRNFAVACLCFVPVIALPALAGELDAFVAAEDGALSCWSRVYDADHLASHPDQMVSAMTFGVSYMAETSEFGEQYSFWLEASLRDGARGYTTGPCNAYDGKMWCGVECDGGGIYVEARADGDVLIDLETHGYIRMSGSCGSSDENGISGLESGKDDKLFLLQPTASKACKAAVLY